MSSGEVVPPIPEQCPRCGSGTPARRYWIESETGMRQWRCDDAWHSAEVVPPIPAVWGDDVGVTWANAPDAIKEQFALTRLYWFFRMIACGGPDGSDLDFAVAEEAREAAEWFGPILQARAEAATS